MPLGVVPRRDRKLNRWVKAAPILSLDRGEVLYRAGTVASSLYLIRGGHLRLEAGGVARAVAGPWELVGDGAVAGGRIHLYDGVAGESLTYQVLSASGFARVLGTSRVTREAYLGALQRDAAVARSLARGVTRVEQRLAAVIADLVDRLGTEQGGLRVIPIRLTHMTLAELVGAHRSTVTTLLNEWLYTGDLEDVGRQLAVPPDSSIPGWARSGTSPH